MDNPNGFFKRPNACPERLEKLLSHGDVKDEDEGKGGEARTPQPRVENHSKCDPFACPGKGPDEATSEYMQQPNRE